MEQNPTRLKKLQPKDRNRRHIRILCVEDAEIIRDTLVHLLEAYGYKVATAKNGKEGIEMALRWRPDLILMDLRMPVMDGYNAMHDIRFNPQTQHIPIFVVSGWSGQSVQDQAKLVGANGYFVKPFDLKQLITAIRIAVAASP